VHSANSNDTSPDSEVMSSLSIAATEEEKKKLFSHPNSVEEELPHVPTTLPQERSVQVIYNMYFIYSLRLNNYKYIHTS